MTVVFDETNTRPFALFVQTNSSEKNIITSDAVEKLLDLSKQKGIPYRHIDDTITKSSNDSNATRIARAISLNLRHGVLIKNIVFCLDQVNNATVGSFTFAIKKFLSQFIMDGEKIVGKICDNCGSSNIIYKEGCFSCSDCSYSKCG